MKNNNRLADSIFIDNIVNPPRRAIRHINKEAQKLGKLGGEVKSEAKAKAAKENGKLGGRPKSECFCPLNNFGLHDRLNCICTRHCKRKNPVSEESIRNELTQSE